MKTVAHFVRKWLPKSETFIYRQVKNAKKYRPVVLTTSVIGNFPFTPTREMKAAERILFRLTGSSPAIKNYIASENISLLHAHFGTAASSVLKIKKEAGVPMVTSFYGHDCYSAPKNNRSIYKKLFSEGELFLALGKEMKKELISLGCPEEKIKIHHLGVKEEKYRKRGGDRKSASSKTVFLSVARFIEKKGLDYLIKAFLAMGGTRCELRIVGNGPEREKLVKLARGSVNVKFIDNLSSANPAEVVRREMLNADVFVLPSVTAANGDKEGTPVTIMEASSLSLPCIATQHSDIPEIVEDGKTGFLVAERDVQALREKMEVLASDRKKRLSFGRAANRKIAREFSEKMQAKKLEQIYDLVLN